LFRIQGDVGGEIGLDAVVAHHDAILLVAEGRALEPQGAVLQVGEVALLQVSMARSMAPSVAQRALGEPGVEGDAEFGEVLANVAKMPSSENFSTRMNPRRR
jgi:hypothetical protein